MYTLDKYHRVLFATLPAQYYIDRQAISEGEWCMDGNRYSGMRNSTAQYIGKTQACFQVLAEYSKSLEEEVEVLKDRIRTTGDELLKREHELRALDNPDD
jgi:hypothetical protein